MALLELSLLGSFRAKLKGEPLTAFASDKVRALLAYLAVEADRPHRREQLAALLWPDTSESSARHSLRQTLYQLRKTIEGQNVSASFVILDRRQVQFDRKSDFWLDVNDFESLVAACRRHHGHSRLLCVECRRRLELAIDLYRNSFLAGFSLPDSPLFEEWQLTQQETYHRMAVDTLFQLGEHYETVGEYGLEAGCARRVLELEPWRESAHRRLMRALALDGREAEALRQYAACKNALEQELGVPPAPQTQQLEARIRAGEFQSNVSPAIRTSFQITRQDSNGDEPEDKGLVFVAREAELASLHRHLESTLAGRGAVVFVRGEAGSGKTMLLSEFSRQAAQSHSDLLVVPGSCSALAGQGDTCGPFRTILAALTADREFSTEPGIISAEHQRRLWAAFPSVLQAMLEIGPDLLGAWVPVEPLIRRAQMVSGLDPRLRNQLSSLSGPPLTVDDTSHADRTGNGRSVQAGAGLPPPSQAAIFEQFSRVLLRVARERPLVLLLDDLQWADPASCSLLFHLGRKMAGNRILVVGAYRAEDLNLSEGRHPLQPVLRELQAQFGNNLIDLAEADHKAFIDAYLDLAFNQLDEAFRETLYRRTEGHPLFAVELLHNLQTDKGLVQDEDGKWVVTDRANWTNLPPRVEAVIAERVERVPLSGQQLLSAASVQADVFGAEVVAEVLGEGILEVTQSLSNLLGRQNHLVQSHSISQVGNRSLSRYRFRHHLIRQYLYDRLDDATRARLHRATAEVLQDWRQTQTGQDPVRETSAARLAWHFEQAGMAQEAIHYLLEAGREAYQLSASEQSITYLIRGLELLKQLPHTQERDRLEYSLQAALGQPLLSVHGYAAEQMAYERAAELARQLEEPELLVPVVFLQFAHHLIRGEYRKAEELTKHLLSVAERTQIPYHILQSSFQASQLRFFAGDLAGARRHLDVVLALLDKLPDDHTVLHAGNVGMLNAANQAASVLWHQGYPDQALDYAKLAVREAEKLGHAYWLTLAQTVTLCHVHLLRREGRQVLETANSALHTTENRHFPLLEILARIYSSCAQIEMGNAREGLAQLDTDLTLYQDSEHRFFLTLYLAYQARACCIVGEIRRGLDVIANALDLVDKGDHPFEAELYRVRGDLYLASNDADLAERAYMNAIRVATEQEAHGFHLRTTNSVSRMWQQQGRRADADQMLGHSCEWFHEGLDTVDMLDAKALLKGLATTSEIIPH